MTITSSAFVDSKMLPVDFSCRGQNVNPPLEFHDLPANTKSLTLIMDDPDIPRNIRPDGMFIHWLIWNLPASTTTLAQGALPPGVVGLATNGQIGYVGPCPPAGEHRYYFRLYALDTELVLPSTATKGDILRAMDGHILDQAQLMARFGQPS